MFMTIEDIMRECGVCRQVATRLAIKSGCLIPRKKNQKYLVKAEAFRKWVKNE